MFLKSLEIQGFKSFPDKTKIQFGKGLTAVVGPNGSGKSNISDAVRWVMGEQSTKNLRGSKMEDVIFTGTKNRKSQGFAEVSLHIDNSDKTLPIDSDEVIVTRKYYRSGESDYKINQNNVRLKDINELFMDTGLGKDGYAMVGQGRIAEIVQSKSDERREIFEEAAGISKYRYRKNEAQRKLQAAEDNLLRLGDILKELESRVEPLRIQSQKAKEFLDLSEQKKTVEISSWMYTLEQSNRTLKDQGDRILARELEHKEVEKEAQAMEEKIQSCYDKMQACLLAIDEMRKEKEEVEQQISTLSSEAAVSDNELLHNEQNRERIQKELSEFQLSGEQLKAQINQRLEEAQSIQKEIEKTEEEIRSLEQQLIHLEEESGAAAGKSSGLNQQYNTLLVQQSQHKMSLMQISSRREEEEHRFENNKETLRQKEEQLSFDRKELEQAKSLYTRLEERMQELRNSKTGLAMKWDNRKGKYDALSKEIENRSLTVKEYRQRAGLLEDLEKNLEGYAYSVKAVLTKGKQGVLSGIQGTVSQLIEVPEKYQVALETALGGSMQHIVVETEENGKSAIRYLKQQNAGRATFLPMTAVKGTRLDTNGFDRIEGYVALAAELVSFDDKYRGVIDSLLGRIVITEDLDTAVEMAKQYRYRFRIVTLDGQVVNAGGSMSGGSRNKSQGFFSRKNEIASLTEASKKLETAISEQKETQKKMEEELSALQARMLSFDGEMTVVKEDQIRCEGEQKRLEQQISQSSELLASMRKELSEFHLQQEEQENQEKRLREELAQLEKALQNTQEELQTVQSIEDASAQKRNALSEGLSSLRMKKLEQQKDKELLDRTVKELTGRSGEAKQRVHLLESQLDELAQRREEIYRQKEENQLLEGKAREKIASLAEETEKTMLRRNELEKESVAARQEEKGISFRKEQLSQELVRLEERKLTVQKEYDTIIEKLWEEYQLTKPEAQAFVKPVEDIQQCNRELNRLKNQIRALGNVNVAAIEEYQEVSQRYAFLSGQMKDAEASREELIRLIEELTAKMREIFAESFQEINRNFQQIFVDLFGGGRAQLKLTDESDVLNSGIEIFVEPPGKIIKNLTLLSGGEQAFVAIAIYFAILKVRPAPFCILDEIEAALDDVNVTKYAKYLRLMSDNTQFIMITHRRGSMEEADVLYGVAMQEEGVSKLLQLNVGEIEREFGKLEE